MMYEYVPHVDVYMSMTNLKTTVTKMYVITVNLLEKARVMKMVAIKNMKMPKNCLGCSTKCDPENRKCNIDGHVFEETFTVVTSRRDKDCPLVETKERKVGKWEYGYSFPDGNYAKCTACNEIIKCTYPMHFCPNCGADMRGTEECPEPLKPIDKVKEEIERQRKWLFKAGYNAHNIDIAFDAIKSLLKEVEE